LAVERQASSLSRPTGILPVASLQKPVVPTVDDAHMKIDLHTHILPHDWPDLDKKYGYPGFVRLDHYKPCCARMMTNDFGNVIV
jgi:hypothetical protein